VAVTNNASATFPVGVTTVTYTASDAAGNVATATQRVIVSFVSTVGGGTGGTGGTGGGGTPPTGGGATVGVEAVYWHHNDHLGTPQALTDINGTVVWTMSQTPFGIATVNEDPDGNGIKVTNNFRFPGQYFDAETGLNYNYFRSYDPAIGAYPQHDPIGLDGSMNPFRYVGGNPISLADSTGLAVYLTSHRVLRNARHLALLLVPDNQSYDWKGLGYRCGGSGDGIAAGKWYITISAYDNFGYLSSEKHRSTDQPSRNRIHGQAISSEGLSDTEFNIRLLALDAFFPDYTIPYAFPWDYNGYNSNSFATGILNAARAIYSIPDGNFPLANNPVPARFFGR